MTKRGKVWVYNGNLKLRHLNSDLSIKREASSLCQHPSAEGCLAACGTVSQQDVDCLWEGRKGFPGKTPPLRNLWPCSSWPWRGWVCETLPIPKGQKAQAQSPPEATQSKMEWWIKSALSLRYPSLKSNPKGFVFNCCISTGTVFWRLLPVEVSCLYLRLKPAETKVFWRGAFPVFTIYSYIFVFKSKGQRSSEIFLKCVSLSSSKSRVIKNRIAEKEG